MQFTLTAEHLQAAAAAAALLVCGAAAWRRWRGGVAPRQPPSPLLALALGALIVGSFAVWFGLGRHPLQLVKTWDAEHSVLGAKYAPELGYFRLYTCLLAFDGQGPGFFRGIGRASDLRGSGTLGRPALLARSDCAERFTPERRSEFQRDVAFFESLARKPDRAAWFQDNAYNQTPFFTSLLGPLLAALPLSYELLRGLALLDVALALLPFPILWRVFGARIAALTALYTFSAFSNQFPLMGGAILRYATLSLLLLAAAALRAERPRAAGAALGGAALFGVFPGIYLLALLLAAAGSRRRPGGPGVALRPLLAGWLVTVAAGLAWSAFWLGPGAWLEFAQKIGLHGQLLSQYRVGLKLLFAWDAPAGAEAALRAAFAHRQLAYFATGAALLAGAGALWRRLPAADFAWLLGAVALYVATPVHYYFAVLALLLLAQGRGEQDPAPWLGRALLFGLSALAHTHFVGSRDLAWVNNVLLSAGLGAVLLTQLAAAAASGLSRGNRVG